MTTTWNEFWLGELHAEIAVPREANSYGVLVIPHHHGLGEPMRWRSNFFVEAGITSLIYDPYSGFDTKGGTVEPPPPDDRQAIEEQRRWLDYMQTQLGVDRVAVAGYSKGGRMALNFAASDERVRACTSYWPSLHDEPAPYEIDALEVVADIKCPVQLAYPELDQVTSRKTFLLLRERLEARPYPTFVQYLSGATHGVGSGSDADRLAGRLIWPLAVTFLKSCLDDDYFKVG